MNVEKLPPVLLRLASLMELPIRKPCYTVFAACARAIGKLHSLSANEYVLEDDDAAAWDKLAVVPGHTRAAVAELLGVMDVQFAKMPPLHSGRPAIVTLVTKQWRATLVSMLEESDRQLRDSGANANRWHVLAFVDAERERLRFEVGDFMLTITQLYASVDRAAVVPGFAEEAARAAALRDKYRVFADSTDLMGAWLEDGDQALAFAATLHLAITALLSEVADMGEFGIRALDRQVFERTAGKLHEAAGDRDTAIATINDFRSFFWGLATISERETLRWYDQSTDGCVENSLAIAAAGLMRTEVEALSALRPAVCGTRNDEAISQLLDVMSESWSSELPGSELSARVRRLLDILDNLKSG